MAAETHQTADAAHDMETARQAHPDMSLFLMSLLFVLTGLAYGLRLQQERRLALSLLPMPQFRATVPTPPPRLF